MALPPVVRYGTRYSRGVTYQRWIDFEIMTERCPVGPSQLTVDQFHAWKLFRDGDIENPFLEFHVDPEPGADVYEVEEEDMPQTLADTAQEGSHKRALGHLELMADIFKVDLPNRDNYGEFLPTARFQKLDPAGSLFSPDTREGQLKNLLGDNNTGDRESLTVSWEGIVSVGSLMISWVRRNHDQPPLHEVTNAIYSHLVPTGELRYIFLHNIVEPDTRNFILDKLFGLGESRSNVFPLRTDPLSIPFSQRFVHGSPEYYALHGTIMGKMIGRFILGRYPRGTCKLSSISVGLSGYCDGLKSDTVVDMMFELTTTEPPHQLTIPEGSVAKAPAKGTRVLGKRLPAGEQPIEGNQPRDTGEGTAATGTAAGEWPAQKETPKAPIPEPLTPEPLTPEPLTPEPLTPEPLTPKAPTPEPLTPEPLTPEPLTPEPKAADPRAERRAKARRDRKRRKDEEQRAAEEQGIEDDKRYGTTRSGKRRKKD
ncbi:hypothetical protein N7528_007517 [Penicillium herquei]|nr:hypothetical protein N7528_007517 [Penicillium herquei]